MHDDNDPPQCEKCGDEYLLPDGYERTEYCDPCAQELAVKFREALEEIAEPLKFMRQRAEAEGGKLDLMAWSLSKDHQFLKSIALAALKGVAKEKK